MNFEEYLRELQKIYDNNPNLHKAKVITAVDTDLIMSFHDVNFRPTVGELKEGNFEACEGAEANAVCLN